MSLEKHEFCDNNIESITADHDDVEEKVITLILSNDSDMVTLSQDDIDALAEYFKNPKPIDIDYPTI